MQNSSKGNNSWKNHRTRTRRWYAHPPSILNIPMKFQWNPTSSFREFAWTRTVPYIFMQNSSKGNNSWKNHRTRTRRWYAHPPLILNIPMKFHWNPTSSFREFAWTRAGRTHGRTDTRTYRRTDARTHGRTDARTHGRSGDYMLPRNSSGSINKLLGHVKQKASQHIIHVQTQIRLYTVFTVIIGHLSPYYTSPNNSSLKYQAIVADYILFFYYCFFFFFIYNKAWYYMWIVCLIFSEKEKNIFLNVFCCICDWCFKI